VRVRPPRGVARARAWHWAQQGCAVDGTAAAANPLSQLVNQVIGGAPPGAKGAMSHGPMHPGQQQGMARPQSDIERGMAMGLHPGSLVHAPPSGPVGWGQAPAPGMNFAREFEQQFRQDQQQQHLLGGPPQNWVKDFERMHVNPMDAAYHQNFHGGSRAQGWAHEMARGPMPPSEMEMAWRQQQREGQKWASEMAQRQVRLCFSSCARWPAPPPPFPRTAASGLTQAA